MVSIVTSLNYLYATISSMGAEDKRQELREVESAHKIAVLWNGQNPQKGMGEALYSSSLIARDIYNTTALSLGVPRASLHLNTPNPDIQDVQYANAPFNISAWKHLQLELPKKSIQVVGGHSFGEATACVASGAIEYEDFLTFLKTRTELMWEVNQINPGALMALSVRKSKSLEEAMEKEAAFKELSDRLQQDFGVEVATFASNSRQTIGGRVDAIQAAVEYAKKFRNFAVAQIISLNGAPHTSLYQPIVDDLRKAIRSIPNGIKDPEIPVITCSKKAPKLITTAQEIEDEIVAQATQPVHGDSQHTYLINNGYTIIQVGESQIIAGNVKDDFGDAVELEEVTSRTGRNVALGVGGAVALGAAITLGWKVTHKGEKIKKV